MESILDWILRLLMPMRRMPAVPRRAFGRSGAGRAHREVRLLSLVGARCFHSRHFVIGRRDVATTDGRAMRSGRRVSLLVRIPVELRLLSVYRNLDSVRPVVAAALQDGAGTRRSAGSAAPGNHHVQSLLRLARANRLIPLLDRSGAVRRPIPATLPR